MRALFLILTLSSPLLAQAQRQGSGGLWLNADYTYTNFTYKETGLTEVANLAGVRGNMGMTLFSGMGITVGGEYQDGNLNFNGTTLTGVSLQTINHDYIKDVYALVDLVYGSLTLSGGLGQREMYDALIGYYRRREIYNYYPISLTINRDFFYAKIEGDLWKSGHNESYMSDISSTENNVILNQSSGTGYGAEIGFLLYNAGHFSNRIYLSYHHWDIAASSMVFDGVRSVSIVKNSTTTLQGGIGVSF